MSININVPGLNAVWLSAFRLYCNDLRGGSSILSCKKSCSANKRPGTAVDEVCWSGGYTLQEVSEYFGLHYTSVKRIVPGNAKYKT